jgi:hypothetical protein
MMAKPIFIVCIPIDDGIDTEEVLNSISEQFQDYHVLVASSEYHTEITFKCFYEKDFDEVKYDELKGIVKGMVNAD